MGPEFIGDREVFAVELRLKSLHPSGDGVKRSPYGGVRFWVRGQKLGDVKDHTFFWTVTSVAGALRHTRSQEDLGFQTMTDAQCFDLLYGRDDQLDFRFITGEGFDRFCVFVLREEDQARFVWRERRRDQQGYRVKTYGARVPFDECERVASLFVARVDELRSGGGSSAGAGR